MKTATLQQSYDNALALGKEHFMLEGKTFLVSYARYLLEYLNNEGITEFIHKKDETQ